jgi:hypothetical protein
MRSSCPIPSLTHERARPQPGCSDCGPQSTTLMIFPEIGGTRPTRAPLAMAAHAARLRYHFTQS